MNEWATTLREHASGSDVPAVIHNLLTREDLFTAEEQWCMHRIKVLRELASAGHHDLRAGWPASVHWSWARKGATCRPSRVQAFGDARVFGVEADGQWQSLLYALSEGYEAQLGAVGRQLVNVDFIESAPWSWDVFPLGKYGRYPGGGKQLMELAVRWSQAIGYEGRIGLHALSQPESFYEERCRMRNLGPDASYDGLCYFELAEADALALLEEQQP